jgi:ribosomal protein S18 acetylase RimI-like enzyme
MNSYPIRYFARPNEVREHPEKGSVLQYLDAMCFPGEPGADYLKAHWWLARTADRGILAGFAAVEILPNRRAYMSRVGVLPWARGNKLQRRFLAVRERLAKKHGCTRAITFTTRHNSVSANNLIRSGYLSYWPAEDWGNDEKDAFYWYKDL